MVTFKIKLEIWPSPNGSLGITIAGFRSAIIEDGFDESEVTKVADQRSGRSSSITKRYDVKSFPVFSKPSVKLVRFPTSASHISASHFGSSSELIMPSVILGITTVILLVPLLAFHPSAIWAAVKMGAAVTVISNSPANGNSPLGPSISNHDWNI